MSKLAVLLFVLVALLGAALAQVQFRVIRQWKYLNYTWPSEEALQTATANGVYIPENVVTAGIMHHDGWYYLTMPRMRDGVPATLGRVTAKPGGSTAPKIEPFPSWEFNKLNDCNALQNVQNIEVDFKGKLWIIDGGHTGSLTSSPSKTCAPKLVIFDVINNATTTVYTFPESVASKNDSFLYDLVIDGEDFAYITDNSGRNPGIIVFSLKQNRSWKIRHPTMRADPSAQSFKVNDVPITTAINVAGIALAPKIHSTSTGLVVNEDREVYYCPMSSLHLYSISTSVLQNENNSNNGQDYAGEIRDVGLKSSQTDGMIMTNQGVLFYGLLGDNSVAKWDSRTPFASGQKVVSRDVNYIQWTNSFTMDQDGNVIVLSNTLQKFVHQKLDLSQYNFWLLSAQVGGKSYIYEDSSFNYSPTNGSNTTPHPHAWSPTPQPEPEPEPSSSASKVPDTHSLQTSTSKPVTGTSAPDGANQQVLEFSVILVAVSAWFFCRT